MKPTVVFIVESGMHDSQGIAGVYATLEAAKAAFPGNEWTDYDNGWSNDKDWDDALWIRKFEVKS